MLLFRFCSVYHVISVWYHHVHVCLRARACTRAVWKSSWTHLHLITTSPNFVEVRWRSLFRSISLGKRCASYNAPPTSRKRAADRLPQASGRQWNRRFWTQGSVFMVRKVQKSHGARSELYGGCSNGVPPISVSSSTATFQSRNADAPLRLHPHPKKGSFKPTVTPFSGTGWSVVRSARSKVAGEWSSTLTSI
jgi:hypothetical protein